MDDERLKQAGGGDYWKEFLARIRDIRFSEKLMYRQVLDLYATSVDYNPKSSESIAFFKMVQNKLHYAVNRQTADTYWKFQEECRFVLFGVKKSDLVGINMNNLRELLSRGINLSSMELNYIDLQITDYFFKNLEITTAPLMSEAYYDLLDNYLHNKISQPVLLHRSALKIRK